MRGPSLVVVCVTLLACGPGEDLAVSGPIVDSIQVVEELRVGVLDGVDEYLFGNVTEIETTDAGTIFVYDAQPSSIRMYDPSGEFTRTVATSGEGPGEVRQVTGMDITPAGDLAVWDPSNQRVSLFSPSGDFLTSHRVLSGLNRANTFHIDRSGNYYIKTIIPTQRKQAYDWEYEWVRVGSDGVVLDTVSVPQQDNSPREQFIISSADGMRWPFTESTYHAIDREGRVISGRNSEYALSVGADGVTDSLYQRSTTPVELNKEEHKFWEAARAMFESLGQIAYQPIPRSKPLFRDLVVDHDGRLWVDRYTDAVFVRDEQRRAEPPSDRPIYEWREPATFDVILEDGTWWGTVPMPVSAIVMSRRGDLIWGRVRGEADEHYVVRWRMVPIG